MKSTEGFKEVIQLRLTEIAKNDPLFNKSFQKESKNIDDCIKYIKHSANPIQKGEYIHAIGYRIKEQTEYILILERI